MSGLLVAIVAIVAVFSTIIVRIMTAARARELEIRERIAMIEKGLVPPPEKDPGGFERAMAIHQHRSRERGPARHRRAGVTLVGVGFGLMFLLSMIDRDIQQAIGIGGFLIVLGLTFLVVSYLPVDPARPSQPSTTPDPSDRVPPVSGS